MRVTCRLLAVVALAALLAPAAHASLRASLAAALHRPPLDARRVGAIAVDLATGRVVFAQNPWLSLAPASNEKLAVTYAVLKALGPGFRSRTEVRGEGFLDGQVWRGSLILKGYGDPTLDRWALADLARQVRALGIHVVTGSLVGDESWFDAHRAAPGWRSGFEVQESRPLSALVVDRGPVTLKPALVATSLFRTALRHAGVRVFGSSKVVRAGGFPLATHLSAPLEEIVRAMDLESDNFTAEMLLKELGATLEGAGTTTAGAALVRETLAAGRVPLAGVSIVDGSGLSLLDRLLHATVEELQEVEGIGPDRAESIADWFADEQNRALVAELRELGLRFEAGEEERPVEGPLTGQAYVITGTLESYSREEARAALEALGAKVSDSVSSRTTGVIVGEEPGKSKLTKAEKAGVPILTEADLLALLGRS